MVKILIALPYLVNVFCTKFNQHVYKALIVMRGKIQECSYVN